MIGAWAAVIVAVFLFGGVTDRPWLVGLAALLALVTAVIAGAGSRFDEGVNPRSCPVGTRVVASDGKLGTIIDWQGEVIVRIEYDDGIRSIGRVHPMLRRA